MNIRCSFCQMPYTLSRIEMLDALQEVESGKLAHYDAHCPRCKRATPIPRQRMEMFMPNWRNELKKFEVEMKEHPQQEAPLPKPEPASVAAMGFTPEPAPVGGSESKAGAFEGKKPAGKPAGKSAAKKEAAKPSGKAGAPAKKPAAGKKSGSKK